MRSKGQAEYVAILAMALITAIFLGLMTRFTVMYREASEEVQRAVSEVYQASAAGVGARVEGSSIQAVSPQQLKIYSVLIAAPTSILYEQVYDQPMTLNASWATLYSGQYVDEVESCSAYLVLITDRGAIMWCPTGGGDGSVSGVGGESLLFDVPPQALRPVVHVGIRIKDSFIDNPVPGLPSDPEANYLPVGTGFVGSDSLTISKGDWYLYIDPRSNPNKLGITYGSGSTTINYLGMGFYRLDSSHSVYVKWYELVSGYSSGWYITYETIASGTALLYLYPMIISGSKSFNVVFYIENLGNPIILSIRPVVYVVSAEDLVKGLPIMSGNINPILESAIRYSSSKPLYVWEGSKVSTYLSSGGDISVTVGVDTSSILNALGFQRALALVCFRLVTAYSISLKVAAYITDYPITLSIASNEVGKYVFIPTASNLVPEVISPSGSKVGVYRSPNVASSLVKYLTWFTLSEVGNYTVVYRLGSYTSIPEVRLPVNLTGISYSPVLEYIRNQHLSYSRYVIQDSVTLERDRTTLIDFEYFEAGSETWYSGDLIVVSGLPSSGQFNLTYYVNTVVQGVRTLNLNQNTSFDLYYCWSSWSCYYYWRIYVTSYPNTSTTKLYIRGDVLWHTGSYYLSFGVRIPLVNTQVIAYPSITGIKYVYRAGNTAYAIYVASTFTELVRQNNAVLDLRS